MHVDFLSPLVYIWQLWSEQRTDRAIICRVTNWLLMGIYVQWCDLQLTKAKILLVTWDYEIILTNGGLVYNDLFPFLQDTASCSPHYLWVALKSRYRRMNVRLSVCVMGLIMVSCALHNEPHPHKKLSSLLWRATHSSCFSTLSLQVAVWSIQTQNVESELVMTSFGNYFCSCFSYFSAPSFANT